MSSADYVRALDYLERFQDEVASYLATMPNPTTTAEEQMLNLVEEVGELARALLKRKQGIRGTREEWDTEVHKEIGDVFISLLAVAHHEGLEALRCAADRWWDVKQRNWTTDPIGHGLPEDTETPADG